VKNGVHVLPNSSQAQEDFEWLKAEVRALGGQATVFEASTIEGLDDKRLRQQFHAASKPVRIARRKLPVLPTGPVLSAKDFRGRQWVTRPRPGVDRFASAWLIRRFIDPNARFFFATSPERWPEAVPFDMYQSGGFKHEGDLCTFEVLTARFGIRDDAVKEIGEIVHDLDLKEQRFGHTHAPTIGKLVDGLRASYSDDVQLLEHGTALFEALYLGLRGTKKGKPAIT